MTDIILQNVMKTFMFRLWKHIQNTYLHFTVGLNQFSDMTFAEFKKSYLLTEPQVLFLTRSCDQ